MLRKIKDESVIGGDKETTPIGILLFERIHITDNPAVARYFKGKVGYSVK